MTAEAQRPWIEEAIRAGAERRPDSLAFTIYDAADAHPVGIGGLDAINHLMGYCGIGMMIGERRRTGIGTDATRLLLRWAFEDLGLHNVGIELMDWNAGALRAYERAGFRPVGRRRDALMSGGRRCDMVLMDAVPGDVT